MLLVLGSLTILTALFAVSAKNLIGHAVTQRGDLQLSMRHLETTEALKTVLAAGATPETPNHDFRLIDLGGYIDLNTGDPRLIAMIVSALDLPDSAVRDFTNWRRTPLRVLRLEDFLRVVGAPPDRLYWLQQVATVHSGRRGIDPESAPEEVLRMVVGRDGQKNDLEQNVPAHFITPPSGVNFRVWAQTPSGKDRPLGILHLPAQSSERRILWLN